MSKYKIVYQKDKAIHKIVLDNLSDLPPNTISIKKISKRKFKGFSFNNSKNLYSFFYELNTILQANLTLLDAILIIKKNNYDKNTNKLIEIFYNSLINGQYIHKNLQSSSFHIQRLIIRFIKIGELSGNIKGSINSITKILEQTDKNKKKIIKSFTYPFVLSFSLFISIVMIFNFVLPKFQTLYERFDGDLPISTQYLLSLKNLFDNYLVLIFTIGFISMYISFFLYKKSTIFKEKLDRFLLTKIPIVSNMLLVSNSSNFFFCLSTLLIDKHQFYDSLKNSKTLISNKYLYNKISHIQNDIKGGKSITKAFEDSELFDDLTIRLINTGEKSNNLSLTISKVDTIYKEKLNKVLQNFITVFEPTIIAFMAIFIMWLVLAIFTPIWDIGTILK